MDVRTLFRYLIGICCLGLGLAGFARADTDPPSLNSVTKVFTYLYLEDINQIRLDSGTYDVAAQLVLKWFDPRLASDDKSAPPKIWLGSRAARQIEQIWHPVFDISGVSGESSSKLQALVIYADGTVVTRSKFQARPRFDGELWYYPFGHLSLDLTITNVGLDTRHVELELGRLEPSDDLKRVDAVLHGNWTPESITWRTQKLKHTDLSKFEFSQIFVSLGVAHDFIDGLHKVILPLAVIAVASWGLLWINFIAQPSFSSPRIGGIVTLILTTIALKFVIGRELPVVHYLTFSDVLFNTTILMLSLGMLVSCAIAVLFTDHSAHRAAALHRVFRWIYPIVFLVVLGLSCVVFLAS